MIRAAEYFTVIEQTASVAEQTQAADFTDPIRGVRLPEIAPSEQFVPSSERACTDRPSRPQLVKSPQRAPPLAQTGNFTKWRSNDDQ